MKNTIATYSSITNSPAQAVKILIALAVYCTFGLQFYVCLDIAWVGMKDKFQKRPTLVNYTMRYVEKNKFHMS